jgi:hypothetical protein
MTLPKSKIYVRFTAEVDVEGLSSAAVSDTFHERHEIILSVLWNRCTAGQIAAYVDEQG